MRYEVSIKCLLLSTILIAACATAEPDPASEPAIIYEVTNGSACTARITLHDAAGNVIENIKYPELRPGRTQRFRVPSLGMKLDAIGIDPLGNDCGALQNQKIKITRVQ